MSGLSAGIRLAHFGKKVAILERHDRVGGLNSYYSLGGYDIDVGLHAVTNYALSRKSPTGALGKILRQLRIRPEELDLSPQKKSRISFPSVTLDFTNDFAYFIEAINEAFPSQKDNFRTLVAKVEKHDPFKTASAPQSTREMLLSIIREPLLVEMLLAPLMYYGNPIENDMDFRQFVIMFKSIYMEGFARPKRGVRQILDLLVERFENKGGELKLNSGVQDIVVKDGKAKGVELYDGTYLPCRSILSSAGRLETIALCPETAPKGKQPKAGVMAFSESVNILDKHPQELGFEHSIIFFSNRDKFRFRRPDEPFEVNDGVICVPDNFEYETPLQTDMVRITNKADHRFWEKINRLQNLPTKKEWHQKSLEAASTVGRHMPDISKNLKFVDIFTPRTVERYTGHIHGAVYGAPVKVWDGVTPVENLFLCGTDQGFLGIIGTMLSGISIANQHLLQ